MRRPENAIVLSHFPNTADAIAEKHAPLVLSGHPHAGHVDSGDHILRELGVEPRVQ